MPFTTFPTHNLYIPSFPLRDEGLSGFRVRWSEMSLIYGGNGQL